MLKILYFLQEATPLLRYLGVGTTNPTAPLDVRMPGSTSGLAINIGNISNGVFGQIQFSTSATGNPFMLWGANDLSLGANFGEKMHITTGGNVGINTAAPLAIFDVRGNEIGGAGTNSMSGTIPVASISGITSFATLVVDNSGKGDLFTASSSGLNRFVITQAGNVGYRDNVPKEN